MARDQQAQTHLQTSFDTAEPGIFQFRVVVAGTLAQFRVDCAVAPAGGSVSFTLWKITGGVSTSIVTLILTSGSTSSSVNLSQAVAVGDLISIDMSLPPSPFGDPLSINVDIAETGASATDAFLLDRANHTGSNPDLPGLTTVLHTTAALGHLGVESFTLAAFKAFDIVSVEADVGCWVRVYGSVAERTNDAGRAPTVKVLKGKGCFLDVMIPDASNSFVIGCEPVPVVYSHESPPSVSCPVSVQNRSGATATIHLTFVIKRKI